FPQPVELGTLGKYRRLGRIQVLGLALPDDAPAKPDEVPPGIADGKGHTLAKAVVAATVIGFDDDTGLDQEGRKLSVVIFRKGRGQAVPVGASPPQAIARGDLTGHASGLQVVDGRSDRTKTASIEGIGGLEHMTVPRHFRLALF